MQITKNLPPGPKGLPLLGNIPFFLNDMIGFMEKAQREYGDIVCFKGIGENIFLVNHPDHIKDILVTNAKNFTKHPALRMGKFFYGDGLLVSEGEQHKRQRKLASPAFTRGAIQGYSEDMISLTEKMLQSWKNGEIRETDEDMMALTLNIIVKTMFNTSVESEVKEIGEAIDRTLKNQISVSYFSQRFDEWIHKSPLLEYLPIKKDRDLLHGVINRIIDEHEKNPQQNDLLSFLMREKDEAGQMTRDQLRDEAITIFLAGHETTANALTWTLYLLSQHPEVLEKLQDEIATVLQGRRLRPEDLEKLRYTEMVISESMRLYPPVWSIGRQTIADYPIADYVVPAGSVIFMSQWLVHRDPRYFPNPLQFDPERFSESENNRRNKYTYFPFSYGPRNCIGEYFAKQEAILILAMIVQKWNFRLKPGHPVEIMPQITLRPKHGVKMIIESRSKTG